MRRAGSGRGRIRGGLLGLGFWACALGVTPVWARASSHVVVAPADAATLEQARQLNRVTLQQLGEGHPELALEPARQALELRERTPGVPPRDLAVSENNLGETLAHLRQRDEAEKHLRRALAIREKELPENDADIGNSCSNLAAFLLDEGPHAEAELLLYRAVTIAENNHDAPALLDALSNQGTMLLDRGDVEGAERGFRRAWSLRPKGPPSALTGSLLNNLASALCAEHDYQGALPLFRQALALSGPTSVNALVNLANASLRLALYPEAIRRAREALALAPEDAEVVTLTRSTIVTALLGSRQLSEARTELAAWGARYASPSERDDGGYPVYLNRQAMELWAEGKVPSALEWMQRAATEREQVTRLALALGPEQQKLAYLEDVRSDLDETLSLHRRGAPENPALARLALESLLRSKGRALDATESVHHYLQRSRDPADKQVLERLAWVRAQLESSLREPHIEKTRELHAQIEQKLRDLNTSLEQSASLSHLQERAHAPSVTVGDVQAALMPDTALVEIAVYWPVDPHEPVSIHPAEPEYVAYVLLPEGEVHAVDLGPARRLDARIERARRLLVNRDVAYPETAHELYRAVFSPLVPLLGGKKKLFISPDGPLNLLPLATLMDESDQYLATSYELTYVTSGRDLLRLAHEVAPRQGPQIFAAPEFDGGPDCAVTGRSRVAVQRAAGRLFEASTFHLPPFKALQGTLAESRALSAILSLPAGAEHTGCYATEGLLKEVHGPSILHVATHGFFAGSTEGSAASDRGTKMVYDARPRRGPPRPSLAPLLQSGIALAFANVWSRGPEDGVVTALELANVDLDGTELVTLSACETGVGRASVGEGIHGFRRALVIAGAETQLLSLWKVDDAATVRLMTDYYTRLKGGEGRSEALRHAQLDLLALPPFAWGAFVVSGDPRPLHVAAPRP